MSSHTWSTRPWATVLGPGVFATPSRDVWLYRSLPLAPLEWEDAPVRLELQSRFDRLLVELGETSQDIAQGVKSLSRNREIHVVSVQYSQPTQIPSTTPPLLADFQKRVLFDSAPKKILVIGVKLRRDAVSALTNSNSDDGLFKRAKKALRAATAAPEDLSLFARDYERINTVLTRAGGQELTTEQIAQLTSWFNHGDGVDTVVSSTTNKFQTSAGYTWQISALMGTDEQGMQMSSPQSAWILDSMNHPEGISAISVRAELEPATVTRGRLRQMQRVLRSQEEEEAATGDVGRDEIGEKQEMARYVENYARSAGHAWLSKTSVLMAREVITEDADETYADLLRGYYGMNVKPLERRQIKALAEMLPGSDTRVNPFPQDVNPAWLAYSGVSGFGDVGDPDGLLIGAADPQWASVYIDPYAAANRNKSPIMGIFGEPGSGKAQPLDALVLTPGGWARMGDLAVGDLVIAVDGSASPITGVFPQGSKTIFTITFDDGTTVRCCDDHLWTVCPSSDYVPADAMSGNPWVTHPLSQLRDELANGANFFVPAIKPDWDSDYTLPTAGIRDADGIGAQERRETLVTAFSDALPEHGGLVAVTRTRDHAQAVANTVRSVGGWAAVFETDTAWNVHARFPQFIAGLLPAHLRDAAVGRCDKAIVSVTQAGSEPAQCISIQHPSQLYVTDGYTVTHNTFAAQLLTAQAALAGNSAIFINPKGFDSLKDFATWVEDNGAPSRVISMQAMEKEGGAFDPFRFVEPKMAAEILTRHINAVLGVTYSGGLTGKQEVELGRGLSEGAINGAQCAMDALQYVRDKDIVEQVTAMVEASTLFALAFGNVPQEPWTAGSGLTLVEFDREMPLPAPGKDYAHFERDERIAVAALRLVSRASLEILMRSRGGVLVVDEAHHFLSSSEGLATLERIGREGRSLGLLPIFATQRVTDLLKVDMESFMSRVISLKLTDPRESEAALRLCRLEATPERMSLLSQSSAGLGFFRDLDGRHSLIQCGAGVPEDLRLAMSTNRADRLAKESSKLREEVE